MSGRSEARPRVAMLAAIPADVQGGLRETCELVAPEALASLAPEARGAITHALTMAVMGAPEPLLDLLPGLRAVVSCGAAVDRFDPAALHDRGIELYATQEVMSDDTADMAVALVYAVLRGLVPNDAHVRQGRWAEARPPLTTRVMGKRAGVVGLGRIGRRVAERLSGAGLLLSYTGTREKPDVPWPFVPDLLRLAAEVDILVLTCAATPATRHLIDARVLAALGSSGFLINVSRGSVADEAALLDALEAGSIAGAGLDVFENEPRPDPRFLALRNVVLQPHASVLTHENRVDLTAELRRLLTL